MAQRKVILEELEALRTIKELAQSYEEIAIVRMQKIRDSVLKTRDFLADISDVYVDLKASYNQEVKDLLTRIKKGDQGLIPTLKKKNKSLFVYLAANGGLYGAVTTRTYHLFMKELSKTKRDEVDIAIIGNAGRTMYENTGDGRPYEFFDIPDTSVDVEHIKKLMGKFLQYENVKVFYGKFGNVVKQSPIESSISGEDIFETETLTQIPREDRFIFEPSLQKIYHFFETQIMANLFSQTLLENQLARHASRVNAMEEALGHIEEETKKLNAAKVRAKHLIDNKKQLETVSGVIALEDV